MSFSYMITENFGENNRYDVLCGCFVYSDTATRLIIQRQRSARVDGLLTVYEN